MPMFRHVLKADKAATWEEKFLIVFRNFPHYWVNSTSLTKLNARQEDLNVSSSIRIPGICLQLEYATGGK